MLRKVIEELKNRRKVLKKETTLYKESIPSKEENISVVKEGDIFKIVIRDNMSLSDYFGDIEANEEFGILNSVSSSLLWNSRLQRISKGLYYVVDVGDRLYNFFMDGKKIEINVRTKVDFDDEIKREDITEEKIITLDVFTNQYQYTSLKHDKIGSTYYTKFYNKFRSYNFRDLDLTVNEAYQEIQKIISDLAEFEWIGGIVNLDFLREHILDDLAGDLPQMRLKVNQN